MSAVHLSTKEHALAWMAEVGRIFRCYGSRTFPLIVIVSYVLAVPRSTVFGSAMLEHYKDAAAVLITLFGLGVRASTIGLSAPPLRWSGVRSGALVTGGLFALCRNPLYLGNLIAYIGIFLMHGDLLALTIGMSIILCLYQCIVVAEEIDLLNRYGDEYRHYCAAVPTRWWPRLANLRRAVKGVPFNLNRVIRDEYGTVAVAIGTLSFTELYEYATLPMAWAYRDYMEFLAGIVVLCTVVMMVMAAAKRRTI